MMVRSAIRFLLAGGLGAGCALLVACGSSGKGLIPASNAGPLTNDFDAIGAAVAAGDCAATDQALARAQRDFAALPSTVDAGLRQHIRDGLNKLQDSAPSQCASQSSQSQTTQSTATTAPTTTQTTTTTPSTSTTTTTSPPTTTSTTPSTTGTTPPPTTSTGGTAGGTPAPAGNGAGGSGAGNGQ